MVKKKIKNNKKHSACYESIGDNEGTTTPRRSKRKAKKNQRLVSSDDYKLRQAVESDGSRTILDIAADGNCLFRSISDQLYHDHGNKHDQVREEVCNFIQGHKDEFSVFLVLDDKDADPNEEDACDFETYIHNMRQDGEWGGHLELVGAARMYRRNITVFSANLAAYTIEHGSSEKSAGPDLILSYHDNDHYNSVRQNSGSRPPPPIKTYEHQSRCSTPLTSSAGESSEMATTAATGENYNDDDSGGTTAMSVEETIETEIQDFACFETFPEQQAQPPPQNVVGVKKSAPCPCGSNLRYRKCCMAKNKQEAKLIRKNTAATSTTTTTSEPQSTSTSATMSDDNGGDDDKPMMMDGDFRVLKI